MNLLACIGLPPPPRAGSEEERNTNQQCEKNSLFKVFYIKPKQGRRKETMHTGGQWSYV